MAKRKSSLSKKTLDRFERAKQAKKAISGKRFTKTSDGLALLQALDDALQSVLDEIVDDVESLGVDRAQARKALNPARQELRKLFDEKTAQMREAAFDPHEAN